MVISTCTRSMIGDATAVYTSGLKDHYLPICLGCAGSLFDELRGAL
jgi:hypothetical protein